MDYSDCISVEIVVPPRMARIYEVYLALQGLTFEEYVRKTMKEDLTAVVEVLQSEDFSELLCLEATLGVRIHRNGKRWHSPTHTS